MCGCGLLVEEREKVHFLWANEVVEDFKPASKKKKGFLRFLTSATGVRF